MRYSWAVLSSQGIPRLHSYALRCRQCVEKCPQHLDIPTILESVVKEFEGSDLEEKDLIWRRELPWQSRGSRSRLKSENTSKCKKVK
jgi:hypothetical protein